MFDLIPFGRSNKNLSHYFDDFDKAFFGDFSSGLTQFRTDIIDKGDNYVLQAELPGFKKEDIKIDLEGDYLTIHAEHQSEKEEKKDQFVRKERHYGSFARSFNVADIDCEKIKASYKDCILELDMPKKTPTLKTTHQIEIE